MSNKKNKNKGETKSIYKTARFSIIPIEAEKKVKKNEDKNNTA